MALQIKKIDNVFCVNGKATATQAKEVQQFFKALLQYSDNILINLCGVHEGIKDVERALTPLQKEVKEGQVFKFYSFTPETAARQYNLINSSYSYSQAA